MSTDEWGFVTDAACRCLFTGKASARDRGGAFPEADLEFRKVGLTVPQGLF